MPLEVNANFKLCVFSWILELNYISTQKKRKLIYIEFLFNSCSMPTFSSRQIRNDKKKRKRTKEINSRLESFIFELLRRQLGSEMAETLTNQRNSGEERRESVHNQWNSRQISKRSFWISGAFDFVNLRTIYGCIVQFERR